MPGSGSSAPGGSSSSCPCFSLFPPLQTSLYAAGAERGEASQPVQRGPSEGVCSRQRPTVRSWVAGGMRAGERSPPGAKLPVGAERNRGGKRGLERSSGLTTAAPSRSPALRLNRRRGVGGCSARLGPARRLDHCLLDVTGHQGSLGLGPIRRSDENPSHP